MKGLWTGLSTVRFLASAMHFSFLLNGFNTHSYTIVAGDPPLRQSGRSKNLAKHVDPLPRLRMNKNTPPFPLYVFLACTNLPLTFNNRNDELQCPAGEMSCSDNVEANFDKSHS